MIQRIRIEPTDKHSAKIYLNDIELKGVESIDTFYSVDSIPSVSITMNALALYDSNADTEIYIHPESIRECIAGIGWEMKVDKSFRNAIIASIKSAIEEVRQRNQTDVITDHELSSRIAERLFLGER